MKILLVVTNADVGGAQKRIIDLATSYQVAGHKVVVASGPFGDHLPDEIEKCGIEYRLLQYLSRSNPIKIFAYIFELWNFLRGESFDVVHLNSSSALAGAFACKLQTRNRPRVVFTFRGLSVLAPGYKTNALKKRFYEWSYKAFLPFVDVGVFQCEANQQVAHSLGIKVNKERVIMSGIDAGKIDFLSHNDAREKLGELGGIDLADKKVVGTIGRLVYAKNYEFLIQQMRKLRKYRQDVVCLIIGDGPERARLEGEIDRLRLADSVFLVGEVKAAAKLLRGFDVFTLTSRYEGLSMTLTEAMHAGVSLLVSDVGCSSSVVGDQRMVFQPGNVSEFIDKLGSLLDADDRNALSEAVYSRCKELVLERSANAYLHLYTDIAS